MGGSVLLGGVVANSDFTDQEGVERIAATEEEEDGRFDMREMLHRGLGKRIGGFRGINGIRSVRGDAISDVMV